MPWPAFTVDPPESLAGPDESVPTVEADVTTEDTYLVNATLRNTTANDIEVQLKNNAGVVQFKEIVPANGSLPPYSPTFEPYAGGMRWIASAAGVKAHIWGY